MIAAEVSEVKPDGLAHKNGIRAGDKIISINGKKLRDILDYELATADEVLNVELERDGEHRHIKIDNPHLLGLGIYFSTSLFDGIKTCANKCVFCFIDQLPPGMREAVYVKDDDYRLSFLYGNFVTLTNMNNEDIDRIIEDRISPLYISLHATNPQLRLMMLGRKKKDKTLVYLQRLSDAGIEIHIQMVMCPGLNDKDELERSIKELSSDYPNVGSVGLVPVGLTGYRDGLYPLRSFEKQEIMELIEQVERWQEKLERQKGEPWVYIADEFYIAAGRKLPTIAHYGEFPQIENGIGLSSLFIDEAEHGIEQLKAVASKNKHEQRTTKAVKQAQTAQGQKTGQVGHTGKALPRIALVTGELFAGILEGIAHDIHQITGIAIDVIPVENKYFGGKVNVTGLLTGTDIVSSARRMFLEHGVPDILVVPDVVLNADGLMLDGYSPERAAYELGVEVRVFGSSGEGFIEGFMEVIEN
ncbi:DUF512 domain-containing protein [Candidatus Aquicultor secundus]|uniref:PDZ domain-containing protein n=3 Tax=Candidatus Aquicultor secundus TaxID=1973895 RepID=A0A2M7T7E9_9ACTN|nr:DUF512 domain-containing protein [Candidatus Aquicultor secundus]PIZ38185.1 MAG: hypothetical protein COY37_06565 [Candidatus Aquicultor secundus]